MKKFLLAGAIAISFLSCSSDRGESVYFDGNTVTSNSNGDIYTTNGRGVVASFTFTAGRKSKNCHGFGICELTAFGIGIVNLPPKAETPKADIQEESSGKFAAYYELMQPLTIEDTTLYVDEDLIGIDENNIEYVIKAGEYNLDNSLGEFGGYKIDVIRN